MSGGMEYREGPGTKPGAREALHPRSPLFSSEPSLPLGLFGPEEGRSLKTGRDRAHGVGAETFGKSGGRGCGKSLYFSCNFSVSLKLCEN